VTASAVNSLVDFVEFPFHSVLVGQYRFHALDEHGDSRDDFLVASGGLVIHVFHSTLQVSRHGRQGSDSGGALGRFGGVSNSARNSAMMPMHVTHSKMRDSVTRFIGVLPAFQEAPRR
jgi:hypothetical protein